MDSSCLLWILASILCKSKSNLRAASLINFFNFDLSIKENFLIFIRIIFKSLKFGRYRLLKYCCKEPEMAKYLAFHIPLKIIYTFVVRKPSSII